MSTKEGTALLTWLSILHDTSFSFLELSDGVLLCTMMLSICPESIPTGTTIHTDSSWPLKSANLRTLASSIDYYYMEELNLSVQLSHDENVDMTKIVQKSNEAYTTEMMIKMTQLVMVAAVKCDNNEHYVHTIMEMPSPDQVCMQGMIQHVITQYPMASPHSPVHVQQRLSSSDLSPKHGNSTTFFPNDTILLEQQIVHLKEDKKTLTMTVNKMKIEREEHLTREESTRMETERKQKILHEKRSEASKMQMQVDSKLFDMEKKVGEKEKALQMESHAHGMKCDAYESEIKRQADELDICRSKMTTMGKMESTLSKYKTKLEESTTLRQQLKEMDDQNGTYLDKILDLECTIKTIPLLKTTLEKYKDQLLDLETSTLEAKNNATVREQTVRTLEEELESATAGREFLEAELEAAQASLAQVEVREPESPGGGMGIGDSYATLKEQVTRLERENQTLRNTSVDGDELRTLTLENDLEDVRRLKSKVEEKNVELKLEVQALGSELAKLKVQVTSGSIGSAEMDKQYEKQIMAIESLTSSLQEAKSSGEVGKCWLFNLNYLKFKNILW